MRAFAPFADYPKDVELQAVLQGMRCAARVGLLAGDGGKNVSELPWPSSHGSDGSQHLLAAAHRRSLWATTSAVRAQSVSAGSRACRLGVAQGVSRPC